MKSWLNQLAPSIAPTVPRASLGAGLGCWIEHEDRASTDEVGRKGGVRRTTTCWHLGCILPRVPEVTVRAGAEAAGGAGVVADGRVGGGEGLRAHEP